MQRILLRLVVTAWLGLVTTVCFAQLPNPVQRAETVLPPLSKGASAVSQRDLTRSPPAQAVQLEAVPAALLQAQAAPAAPGQPQHIGFARDIAALSTTAATAARLKWQATPEGGLIAALSVTSPGALGIRLGVSIGELPASATLRFYAQGSGNAVVVPAALVLNSIARNLRAGGESDDANTYWAPTVDGSEATLEIELPAGVAADSVHIAMPRLSHLTVSRFSAARKALQRASIAGGSGSCEIDVMCYTAWSKESNATALMQFVSAGESYICTGTLLNTVPTTYIPYFLSANHCISTQAAASTLETIWFYRSIACNSGTINPEFESLTGGATLLYATAPTDTSFMWLDGVPPGGASYAGWSAALPQQGAGITGIHHPMGDLQKIAFGNLNAFVNCSADSSDPTKFSCSAAAQTASNHVSVNFSLGTVEEGSSGSGLYITDSGTGAHYLIGQLHGGTASCSNLAGAAEYGRFDVAYSSALSKYLTPTAVSSIAVSNGGNGSGIVVSAPGGIYCGTSCNASLPSGTSLTLVAIPSLGSSFTGWSGACSGTNPSCTFTVGATVSVGATFAEQSVTPEAGYWWNPAESGRGFVIEVQGSSMFMAGFLYSSSGEATWVASNGPMTSPTQYSGPLVTFSGGQTLTGAYQAPTQNPVSLGTLSINFTSTTQGSLTWPGGTMPIQRFNFGPGGYAALQPATNPQTGWWWNPAESGRGFAIEVQGGAIYLAGYMYDANGNPVWYLTTGNMTGLTQYEGFWQQYGNGQTLTGSYQAPVIVNNNAGSATLLFTSPTTAALTLPNGRQIPLSRFSFGTTTTANVAGNWSGTWQWSGPTSNGVCQVSDGGSLSMTIVQAGTYFAGSNVNATGINTVNTDCSLAGAIVAAGGTASGTLSANNFSIAFTLPAGGSDLTFTGTGTLSNNTLSGTIVRSTGGSGTFSLTLQQ